MAHGSSYPYTLDTFQQINYWKPQAIKKDKSKEKKRKKRNVVDKILKNNW
jgi:hypothetical protein